MTESVPFTIPEVLEGLAEAEGRMRYQDGVLSLDIETKDAILGVISQRREVNIRIEDIEEIELKEKRFKFHLSLVPRRMALFDGVPGLKQGLVTLHIGRKHRKALMLLIGAIESWDGPEDAQAPINQPQAEA